MTRSELIEQVENEFRALREQEDREAEERLEAAAGRDPEIGRLMDEKQELMFSSIRSLLTDRENAGKYASDMRERGLVINGEIRKKLGKIGMPADALEVRYRCGICKDTGYVGEAPKRTCECFKRRLNELLSEEHGLAAYAKESFDTYRDEFIPDTVLEKKGVTQRVYTAGIREVCRQYAETYPKCPKINMLLHGETGLGKTFLMNATAGRLYERGQNVVRVTAYTMFDAMRKYHFSKETDGTLTFDDLLNAPVLFIDDLGTEPMQANITTEYLFVLLNERLHSGLGTVIATNLSPEKLKQHYQERVFSRLCDRGSAVILEFLGKDLRTHGKR